MNWPIVLHCLFAVFLALFIGTLVEYVVHRLMHAGKFFYKIHAQHHQVGQGQGWFWEFKDYYLPSLPVSIIGFLIFYFASSFAAGISFAIGCLLYAALAAYAHQVQHEKPELCFWMKRPVHHIHHNGKMWHHNFGILVDFWDRVFGTYKPVDPPADYVPEKHSISAYFKIKWF